MVIMEYAAGGTLSSKLATDGVGGQPRRFGWCAPALQYTAACKTQSPDPRLKACIRQQCCAAFPLVFAKPRRSGWRAPQL